MKKYFLMSLMALVALTMTSCMSVNIGNGNKDTTPSQVLEINKVTKMQSFNEVDFAGAFKIIYEEGKDHSVRVEASEQAFKEMTVYVKDGELRIRQSVSKPTVKFQNVKIYVTSPNLKKVDLTGSGMFTASNPINPADDLKVDVTGSGTVLLASVNCSECDLEITGSGSIEIGKITAKNANVDITGSGSINLGNLVCNDMDIDVTGSGDLNCEYIGANNVRTDISGSGDVNLKGHINNFTKETHGSGKAKYEEIPAPQAIQ